MGITSKIRSMFETESSTPFEYECHNCSAMFESEETRFEGLTCPECDSNDIRDTSLKG